MGREIKEYKDYTPYATYEIVANLKTMLKHIKDEETRGGGIFLCVDSERAVSLKFRSWIMTQKPTPKRTNSAFFTKKEDFAYTWWSSLDIVKDPLSHDKIRITFIEYLIVKFTNKLNK